MAYLQNKKSTWIIAAVAVVCILGLISLFPSNQNNGEQAVTAPVATTTTPTTKTEAAAPATHTIKPAAPAPAPAQMTGIGPATYLLGLKESLVCTVSMDNAYMKRSGTLYVSGGKMRGNFTSYIDGVLTDTSMIDDGTRLYAWKDNSDHGTALSAVLSASGSVIAKTGGIDPAASLSYACNPWTEDASYFAVPSSVTFSSSL